MHRYRQRNHWYKPSSCSSSSAPGLLLCCHQAHAEPRRLQGQCRTSRTVSTKLRWVGQYWKVGQPCHYLRESSVPKWKYRYLEAECHVEVCAVWILGSKLHSWAHCHSKMTLLFTSCFHGGSNIFIIFWSLGGPEAHSQSHHLSSEMLTLQAPHFQWFSHILVFSPFLDLPHFSKSLWWHFKMIYKLELLRHFLDLCEILKQNKSLLKILLYSLSKSLILLVITGQQLICNKVNI